MLSMIYSKNDVQKLMPLTQGELFEKLVDDLPQYQNTFFSPESKRDAGEKWFNSKKAKLQKKLCVEGNLLGRIDNNEFQDNIALICAISDSITSQFVGIPALTIAMLIFKIGIRNFCK